MIDRGAVGNIFLSAPLSINKLKSRRNKER